MTESVLVFDPGEVTGWSLWTLDSEYPMYRLEYGLIKGGLDGFVSWLELRLGRLRPDILICERFNTKDGRVARADLTPLYLEGALYAISSALGLEVVWQGTDMKALCSDDTLRANGLYFLPSEAKGDPAIMHVDARDVNDSQRHALAYAKSTDHEPTIALYWPDR